MRVDDVRPEPASGASGRCSEAQVAERPAAPRVEHRPLDLVPERDQLPFQVGHEDAEVGLGRARVHLGDEQDPHSASLTDRLPPAPSPGCSRSTTASSPAGGAEFNLDGPEIEHYRRYVEKGPALDVACGTGRLLVPWLEAGLVVGGCDVSADTIELCPERAGGQGSRRAEARLALDASNVPNSARRTLQISPIVQWARSASCIGGSRFSVPAATRATSASAASAVAASRSCAHPLRPLDLSPLRLWVEPVELDLLARRPRRSG